MIADFYTGSIVPPEDLWFRQPFVDELWKKICKEHVLLTAPRRTGKSSVMNLIKERPQVGYLVIYQNIQDLKHPADLFQTIIENFCDQHPNYLRDLIGKGWGLLKGVVKAASDRLEEVDAYGTKIKLRENDPDWHSNWKKHAEELLQRIRKTKKKVLLIVDELPDMLLNMKLESSQNARDFMAWFRKQREMPAPQQDCIRWLVGGSINLAGTLDDLGGIDLINNFATESLPVFTPDQVRQFVREMLSLHLGIRVVEFTESEQSGRTDSQGLEISRRKRIRCAGQPNRTRRFVHKIIRDLMNDFYVGEIKKDRFDFESGLMKAWWRKYYA